MILIVGKGIFTCSFLTKQNKKKRIVLLQTAENASATLYLIRIWQKKCKIFSHEVALVVIYRIGF